VGNLFDLTGTTALITGSSRGIGLASRAAAYVTGAVLPVDGGYTAT
jgi:NAD(P)-dependent dehydrogenase (short-subunit alcohol dehydrogenase family)